MTRIGRGRRQRVFDTISSARERGGGLIRCEPMLAAEFGDENSGRNQCTKTNALSKKEGELGDDNRGPPLGQTNPPPARRALAHAHRGRGFGCRQIGCSRGGGTPPPCAGAVRGMGPRARHAMGILVSHGENNNECISLLIRITRLFWKLLKALCCPWLG